MTPSADDLAPDPTPAPTGAPGEAGPAVVTQSETAQSETAQSELDLGVLSTGSMAVDRALAPLEGLGDRPVSGHAEVFEQVLGELAQTMAPSMDEPDTAVPDERASRDHGTDPDAPPAPH